MDRENIWEEISKSSSGVVLVPGRCAGWAIRHIFSAKFNICGRFCAA